LVGDGKAAFIEYYFDGMAKSFREKGMDFVRAGAERDLVPHLTHLA
jgi:predicted SnoaL-like aldol condensation-catalyzing enzyme